MPENTTAGTSRSSNKKKKTDVTSAKAKGIRIDIIDTKNSGLVALAKFIEDLSKGGKNVAAISGKLAFGRKKK